jgi:hypothetical protein
MIEDFTARHRRFITAQRAQIEEEKEMNELNCEIACLEREFEDWLERERVKREKYEQAMAEKRAVASPPPATSGKD